MKREKYNYILTAHNKDDLVETLYMQNTDNKDYSSIPFNQQNNLIIRPLIDISRVEISKEVQRRGYEFYEDPSNQNLRYKRNFTRHKVIPYLKNKEEEIEEMMNLYYNKIKMYDHFMKTYKGKKNIVRFNGVDLITINRHYLQSVDMYGFKLIIQGSFNKHFNKLIKKTNKYWKELYLLINSDKKNIYQNFSDKVKISIQNNKILIFTRDHMEICKKIKNNIEWMGYRFNVQPYNKSKNKKDPNIFICPKEMHNKGLYVRRWIAGDKYLISNNKSKNIASLFNDKKIDSILRPNHPVVIYNDKIEWIPGLGHSQNNYLKSDNLLSISIEK